MRMIMHKGHLSCACIYRERKRRSCKRGVRRWRSIEGSFLTSGASRVCCIFFRESDCAEECSSLLIRWRTALACCKHATRLRRTESSTTVLKFDFPMGDSFKGASHAGRTSVLL
ncbi:hypothetical protein KP509_29G013500 [Ceratopteris richardii]|uniref:Uncharacterized protein n=1 Tax=Ceratopteris richardii TaxID=49495 RepID=A0A8T2R4V3_CERRI|nr:hypothetical protein KP509_29G013500 [Ceratopteris richardii]